MRLLIVFFALTISPLAEAKSFLNSYISFEVPDNWSCIQEGVAWTCTPTGAIESKEAVIVLAAKVAGPEDNLINFLTFLREPKKIKTRVGTTMPSQVMYAQQRMLGGHRWIQAQHLGSEVQEYYTLYLATVKEQLALLVSFSAERNRYQAYNPVFDRAIKTLKIVASQQLLFPKSNRPSAGDVIGIQGTTEVQFNPEDLLPPPEKKSGKLLFLVLGLIVVILGAATWVFSRRKKTARPASNKKQKSK